MSPFRDAELAIAEEACGPDDSDPPVSRINALRPSRARPRMPDGIPPNLAEAMALARSGARNPALLEWSKWRFAILSLEQAEAQKVETLFWMWRTFIGSPDPAHVEAAIPLVRRVLEKAWGLELTDVPPDFATARKIAARVTRRLEDLPMAWRVL